jgi:hypothetical protein
LVLDLLLGDWEGYGYSDNESYRIENKSPFSQRWFDSRAIKTRNGKATVIEMQGQRLINSCCGLPAESHLEEATSP